MAENLHYLCLLWGLWLFVCLKMASSVYALHVTSLLIGQWDTGLVTSFETTNNCDWLTKIGSGFSIHIEKSEIMVLSKFYPYKCPNLGQNALCGYLKNMK